MEALRTPDDRFTNLTDYNYEPNYIEVDDTEGGTLRMHYVDAGNPDGQPVLLLHGEPTWGYLYRKMIPGLMHAGHRVIVPDQIGFGRSDKPTKKSDYTIVRHISWVRQLIVSLDIENCIFFGQDWGSLIGLAAVLQEEKRFSAIVAANAALPDLERVDFIAEARKESPDPEAFGRWQMWISDKTEMSVGTSLAEGLTGNPGLAMPHLTPGEIAAYDAPYPDGRFQAGVLEFPLLANFTADAIETYKAAWNVLNQWEKPFITAYGKADPVLGFYDQLFQKHVPGASGQPHRTFPTGTHFIQEEEPTALVEVILEVAART